MNSTGSGQLPAFVWPALLSLLLVGLFITPVRNLDLWWHLDSGRWMLEHGRYLGHEVRSFSMPGADWTNFAWLFQVIVAIVQWLGGAWGLLLLKVASWWLILFLLFRSMGGGISPLACVLAAMLFSWQVFPSMHLRPHLFEGIFLAGSVWLFHRPAGQPKIIWYALLIILWANVHASAVVGAAALALHYVLRDTFRVPAREVLLRRVPVALLLWSLVFVTPNGLAILDVLSRHAGGEYLHSYIREWLTPETLPPMMFIALLAIVSAAAFRRGVVTPAEGLLILLFLVIGGGSKRFLFELGLLLVRPSGMVLDALLTWVAARSGPHGRRWAWGYGLVLLASLVSLYHPPFSWGRLHAGDFPVQAERYPHVAMAALRPVLDGEPELRVWNAYGWGGYLGWEGRGALKIFIDGRTPTIFSEEMMLQEKLARYRPRLLRSLLAQWDVDALVLRRAGGLPFAPGDPQWVLVAFDTVSITYVRADIARHYGLSDIKFDPFRDWPRLDAWHVREAIENLHSLLERDQNNDLAWLRLGQIYGFMAPRTKRTRQQAQSALQHALTLNPDNVPAVLALARLRKMTGEDSARVVQPVLEMLDRSSAQGLLGHETQIASLLLESGYPTEAATVLSPDDWREHQRLDRDFSVWLLRLESYTRLGEQERAGMARRMAERMALDAGPTARRRLQGVIRELAATAAGD